MNKVCKKWQVFLIVLCMLFTMTPATVFADDPAGQPNVVDQQNGGNSTGTPPDPGTPTPPSPGTPPDTASPPALTETASPPALTETASPPALTETASPPALTETASPPAFQMLNTVLQTTCNGTIVIEKIIENDPGTNEIFTFEIQKLIDWRWKTVRTVTTAGVGIVTVDGLFAGEYKVKEVSIPDYYVAVDDETDKFTVGSEVPVPVTFTNTYTTGTIVIEKKIKNGIPELQDTFTFEIYKGTEKKHGDWDWDLVRTVTRAGVGIVTVEDLTMGKYAVKEVDIPDQYKVDGSISESADIARPNYSDKVTFTNKYTAGTITIRKTIQDGISGLHDAFTFKIYKWTEGENHRWDWVLYRTVSREGAGTIIAAGLADAKYKIVEQNIDNYDEDQTIPEVPIGSWDRHGDHHKEVAFSNIYTGPTTGSITLTKYVVSESEIPDKEFTFEISGPNDYSTTVAITTNTSGSAIIENLEPGDYLVTEDSADNFYPEGNDYDKPARVEIGGNSPVEFTNYYDPEESEPLIRKEVALYNGTIPTSGFVKSLTTELNQSVIYRISVGNHDAKERSNAIKLRDIYDFNGAKTPITSDLQIWHVDELQGPDGFHWGETYYYIDTLTQSGIYTNTVYHCGDLYRSINTIETGDGNQCEAIASSTAIVTVKLPDTPPDNGNNNGGGSHTKHYDVTYNANYPTGAGISGTVPKDPNSYTKNTNVTVKENTGDLKAGTYSFEGWNTKADGTGTMYPPGSTFKITEDTILYAQWKLVGEPAAAAADPNTGTGDGDAATAETAQAAGLDDVPKTGTEAPLIPMFLLGLLALAGITLCRKKAID